MGKSEKGMVFRAWIVLPVLLMGIYALWINPNKDVRAAEAIAISDINDLKKIGQDSAYPMNGDYILTNDIDLSGEKWIPIGGRGTKDNLPGYVGIRGDIDVNNSNVFSGTFDGNGHVISGMNVKLDGSVSNGGTRNCGQIGLFSIVASNKSTDYAIVKNLIISDVNIEVDFSNGFAAVGALSGEVNGYSVIDNITVVNGTIIANASATCDTVGIGGVIGECRSINPVTNKYITISNIYNGADVVASGTRHDVMYAGGIIGRIAKSSCRKIQSCLNVGSIQYDGYMAYAVASAEGDNTAMLANISDCHYLSNSSKTYEKEASIKSAFGLRIGSLPSGLSSSVWRAEKGCFPVPEICLRSSAAGYIYLAGLEPGYYEGEDATKVKHEITLSDKIADVALTWKSSNTSVLYISGGKAIPITSDIGADVEVTLTAETSTGYSRDYKIIVMPDKYVKAYFDKKYAVAGEPLKVIVENSDNYSLTYNWKVNGKNVDNSTDTYVPEEADLESFIEVTIKDTESEMKWHLSKYFSELPVIYIDTDDGGAVTSNYTAKNASIVVQGNSEFSDELNMYEGTTTIKGRGNSTWSEAVAKGVKKPYKLKLASKSNLLGVSEKGKNKHWVLLANMVDHTNMRNEVTYNFSRDMGLDAAMASTGVVLILNGEYEGMYQLSEHVRVGSSRVNVYDWEGLAEDIAKAICKSEIYINQDALEDEMKQDLSFLTTGVVKYGGSSFKVSDYYTKKIPDLTGGFLFDMDFRSHPGSSKYISSFSTSNTIPMYFSAPEYANTCPEMMDYAEKYINAFEKAIKSEDFSTTYNGVESHYSDLFDMDSLIQYWFVCEITNNWDSMKNSTYSYKDIDGKMFMGPAWDYDWGYGNIVMYSNGNLLNTNQWQTELSGIYPSQGGFAEQEYQKYQWNRYLIKDPYFVAELYNKYKSTRNTVFEDLIKNGGVIDTLTEKYRKASEANDRKWSYSYSSYSGNAYVKNNDGTYKKTYTESQEYEAAVFSFKTFVKKRIAWFDEQFESAEALYTSLGGKADNNIKVNIQIKPDNNVAAVNISSENKKAVYAELIVNGKKIKNNNSEHMLALADSKISVDTDKEMFNEDDSISSIQVNLYDSEKKVLDTGVCFLKFCDESAAEPAVYSMIKTELPPGDRPTPTPRPVRTPAPTIEPTMVPTAGPTPGPDATPAITSDNSQVYEPTAPSQPSTVKAKKVVITVKGKKSIKRNKKTTLTVSVVGSSAKIKWKIDAKSKKYIKLKKKTGIVNTITSRNKKGRAKITVTCGKISKKIVIRII